MTKADFLKRTKSLLRSVIAQRRWLLAHFKGHIDSQWATTELKNLENAASTLTDADRAKIYLEKKETALRFLIPANNKKRHNELRELIDASLN